MIDFAEVDSSQPFQWILGSRYVTADSCLMSWRRKDSFSLVVAGVLR